MVSFLYVSVYQEILIFTGVIHHFSFQGKSCDDHLFQQRPSQPIIRLPSAPPTSAVSGVLQGRSKGSVFQEDRFDKNQSLHNIDQVICCDPESKNVPKKNELKKSVQTLENIQIKFPISKPQEINAPRLTS